MSHTLLFGDDGSACADVGWLWVNSHNWPGWTIEVLHAGVQEDPPAPRELLRPTVAIDLNTTVVTGDPRYELHTRGAKTDLVVIGARGQGFLKRMHLGSTAEWLMHGPSAPLVITRSGRRTRSILLAHDGSVHAEAAQDAVAMLPWLDQVNVHVVAVHEKDDPRQLVAAAANHLRRLAQSVEVHILRPDDLDVFYRPRDLILESAARLNVDLIALGSRGLTTWESINEIGLHRAGSTASGVAQQAQANVLLAQAAPEHDSSATA